MVTPTEFLVRLLIDSSGYNGGPRPDYYPRRRDQAAPSSMTGTAPVHVWSAPPLRGMGFPLQHAASHNGCNGGDGFDARSRADAIAATVGTTYQWIFDIRSPSASDWLLARRNTRDHQVNYDPANGIIVSENIHAAEQSKLLQS